VNLEALLLASSLGTSGDAGGGGLSKAVLLWLER
jgi:hypothetical protein